MKTTFQTVLFLLLLFSVIDAKTQTNAKAVFTIVLNTNDNEASENESLIKRDLELLSVLPVVNYNPEIDDICIISNFVSFDNVVYEICDADGFTVTYGTVSLPKNEEIHVSTSTLPNGEGYIYIVIRDSTFVGEFKKE